MALIGQACVLDCQPVKGRLDGYKQCVLQSDTFSPFFHNVWPLELHAWNGGNTELWHILCFKTKILLSWVELHLLAPLPPSAKYPSSRTPRMAEALNTSFYNLRVFSTRKSTSLSPSFYTTATPGHCSSPLQSLLAQCQPFLILTALWCKRLAGMERK